MDEHVFSSYHDFFRAVRKSKEEYERKQEQLSYEDKIKVLVKLQEKAYATGMTKVKPWPVK